MTRIGGVVRKTYIVWLAFLILITTLPAAIQTQDGKAVVSAVAKAMGAENLRTLQISGSGSNAAIGQNLNPNVAWPIVRVKSYVRQLDFDAAASSAQLIRIQNNAETPQNQVIQSNAPWAQQFDFWVTPYGFLKGAMANPVTLRSDTVNGVRYSVVGFLLQNKYRVEGYINDKNMVERVRTWVDNDVLGDMPVEGFYTRYEDFAGLKVPTLWVVKQGSFPTLILDVSDAKTNVPVTIPAAQPTAPPAPVTVQTEKVADGVYYLRGGSHHSVLVEFADHLAVIEAPQNEARSLAVIAEVNKLVPNKPIRYLINTHHHFDHSGGLRTYVDAGATIVTYDINQAFYERAFAAPRTLNPDRLEQSKKKAAIEVTGNRKVMADAARSLELHLVQANPHNDGMLVAFLPKEKIIVQVDMYTPPAANAPAPAGNVPLNPNAAALLDNLEKLRLDFDTILPLHGPGKATRADLYAFVRKPLVPISALPEPAPPAGGRGGAAAGGRGGGARGGRGGAPAPAIAVSPEDAPLQTLLETACSACHGLDRVNNKKADKDAWTKTVLRMIENGASVTQQDAPRLIDFLARTRGQ
jgi:glyoxylase-like metal-dependent hydrolase (beta-lactamase superfamily II)